MAQQEVSFTSSSGHVEAVSYDEETQELTVTFRGSREYTYSGVTQSEVDELSQSPSAGSFINARIKPLHPLA